MLMFFREMSEQWMQENTVTKSGLALLTLLPMSMFFGPLPTDIALSSIGLLFVFHSWRHQAWSWLKQPWMQAFLALWAWIILRSLFTGLLQDSVVKALLFGRYLLFFAALQAWLMVLPGRRRFLFCGMAVASGFAVIDTLIQYVVGYDLIGRAKWMTDRLTGSLRRPRIGLTLAWIGVPVMAYGFHQIVSRAGVVWLRLAWLVFALGVFAIGLLSGDRGGLLEMLLAFAGFCMFWSPVRRHLWLFVLGLGVLCGSILWADSAAFNRQVALTVDKISHFRDSDYGVVYRGGWQTFLDYPLLGVGTKQYRHVCPKLHHFRAKTDSVERKSYIIDSIFPCGHHPHNLYLEWLAEAGIIGFGLFVVGLGLAFRQLWRRRDVWAQDPWLLGCAMVLMARLVPVLPSGSMHVVWAAVPLWLMLGVLLAASGLVKR